MRIVSVSPGDAAMVERMAAVLMEGFREMAPEAWPTLDAAREEVRTCVQHPGWIARAALGEDGALLGWIGAQPAYDGHAWELHPLVVAGGARGKGVGRALVQDLEERVREKGAATIFLGTDDVRGWTTLGGVDVYPDVLRKVMEIRSLRGHPFEFYRKLGYVVTGIIPDANGFGKPDIFMAKRLTEARGG